jgi:hypothetical protein
MASMTAIVISRALAIMSSFPGCALESRSLQSLNSVWERTESRKAPEALQKRVWRAGREDRAEGLWRMLGPSADVLKQMWRAEVGPRMRGVPPATTSFVVVSATAISQPLDLNSAKMHFCRELFPLLSRICRWRSRLNG